MPPAPGCHSGADGWLRRPVSSLPRLAAVGRAKHRGVLDAGVDRVGIVERRLEMPDARELPRVLRSVVPEMVADSAFVGELVADRLPGLAAVAGALDHLAEPAARLRRVDSIRVGGRSLHVIDLPAAEVRAAHVPAFALAVRGQDEGAFSSADQYSHAAHAVVLLLLRCVLRADLGWSPSPARSTPASEFVSAFTSTMNRTVFSPFQSLFRG